MDALGEALTHGDGEGELAAVGSGDTLGDVDAHATGAATRTMLLTPSATKRLPAASTDRLFGQ